MSGGPKVIIVNPSERVASGDPNRMQAFANASLAELLRRIFDATSTEDTAAGAINLGAATTSPLRAEIINGLLFKPEISSVDCSVLPGVVLMVDPDTVPSADDSPYKMVLSDGVAIGTLSFTANSSGQARVDVVECRRLPDVVSETATRDVFAVSTGLFTPTTVDKAKSDTLQFRIRTGTPGSGFPGTASGWLPLAVACVPNGSTDWDDATVWDVRPLASDLARPLMHVTQPYPHPGMQYALAESPDGTARNLTGVIEMELGARRVGGNFNVDPLTALDIRHSNTTIIEPGFAAVAGPWFIYLCFPFSLPRWCKMLPASVGSRQPGGLRGIPVYTQKKSDTVDGRPASAITLPTPFGFAAATTTNAVMALAGCYATLATTWAGACVVGRWTHFAFGIDLPITSSVTGTITFDFANAGYFPSRAVKLRVKFHALITVPIGTASVLYSVAVRVSNSSGGPTPALLYIYSETRDGTQNAATTTVMNGDVTLDIPLFPNMPSGDQSITRRVVYAVDISGMPPGTTVTSPKATVLGWEMGP